MWLDFFWAFVIGGGLCALAQVAMDKTPFFVSSAHILVAVVLFGEVLGFFGLYHHLIRLAGMGAAVPLCGFGNSLIEGVFAAMERDGLLGVLTGGLSAGAAGLGAVIIIGFFSAIFLKPKG
ncbi:MAG: SpoVA/SpoVAEb family sporulation membrane protein [Bacillota bacterium]|jgi:stage V sporulation protein AE